ncbi:hypothetical protein LTS07_005988 [Exophiala sideris]|uniref:Uncharacterized protein n=1 Tax=Exophiala sideris TaxID=1016849 RepID=A0ABR0J7T5_9EURO|nr:hypothetical protein LTS07_005988 [Exophiala sideris]KAK5058155.1 hypothetical protein LTR69_007152 [Exophiala sideris]KAK5182115.1 hypothetical protein LTR44_005716 [Eurotiomycetes sp. CCFEE 6388]
MSASVNPVSEKAVFDDKANYPEGEDDVQEVAPEKHVHLTVADMLKGTASHDLTPFERKAALINAEIDKMGFGKYQKCIWLLCGFGYFLDLAWAQGVGLTASAI